MKRRYMQLASNRLFWEVGDDDKYPWSVDISVEPLPAKVGVAEGVTHSAVGATMSVEEALSDRWAEHLERAEATWLIPYLKRIRRGEIVTEAELSAHFVRLHEREPIILTSQFT